MASKFPVGQEISYGALAESCSLSEPVTRQVLRQAMLNHVFTEPRKGVVAHTAASRVLAEDEVTRDFVGVAVEDLWKAATRVETPSFPSPSPSPSPATTFCRGRNR